MAAREYVRARRLSTGSRGPEGRRDDQTGPRRARTARSFPGV